MSEIPKRMARVPHVSPVHVRPSVLRVSSVQPTFSPSQNQTIPIVFRECLSSPFTSSPSSLCLTHSYHTLHSIILVINGLKITVSRLKLSASAYPISVSIQKDVFSLSLSLFLSLSLYSFVFQPSLHISKRSNIHFFFLTKTAI